ncbi:hypothetical protein [Pseudonocardia sediminis]|uniref:hypothetical protein n=1 Tax=Pseudonocardia sediminis TaxID=1397368 RepID=UPI001A91549F|nr:hypothetical protein [Pseudonocardia sediminis]
MNLTPHPVRVYHEKTPDRIRDLDEGLLFRIDPTEAPARLAMSDVGITWDVMDDYNTNYLAPVRRVRFGQVDNLPDPEEGTWLVVPLLVARDQPDRRDLLFPTREVRNMDGTVVGCRGFGQVDCGDGDGVDLTLGWSNSDTGPTGMRLYALDAGESPRWAVPHARVAEVPLMERGHHEGDRFRLVFAGDRFGRMR